MSKKSLLKASDETKQPRLHRDWIRFFTKSNLIFKKEHSTEYAIMQLTDEINTSFEKSQFNLGVFIDLSKAFSNVDHKNKIIWNKIKQFVLFSELP